MMMIMMIDDYDENVDDDNVIDENESGDGDKDYDCDESHNHNDDVYVA